MIAQYEEASGKNSIRRRLSGCSLTCLLIVKTFVRIAIREAAKQNPVAYSRAPMLDYLGELVGVHRLPAQAAKPRCSFLLLKRLKVTGDSTGYPRQRVG